MVTVDSSEAGEYFHFRTASSAAVTSMLFPLTGFDIFDGSLRVNGGFKLYCAADSETLGNFRVNRCNTRLDGTSVGSPDRHGECENESQRGPLKQASCHVVQKWGRSFLRR